MLNEKAQDGLEIMKCLEDGKEIVSSLLSTANVMIICLDTNEKILFFNKECERITGYKAEEALGKAWNDIFGRVESSIENGKSVAELLQSRFESTIRTKSREIRTILWSGSVLSRPGSDQITILAVGYNITERHMAEKVLAESKERYKAVWDNVPVGICLTDRNGIYHYVNPAYCEIYGYNKEDLIGKTPEGLIFPLDDPEKRKRHYNRRFDLEEMTPLREYQFLKSNGEQVWVEVTSDFIKHNNKPKYLISMNIDITKRKNAEGALAQSDEKLDSQFNNFPIPTYSWKRKDNDFILVNYNKAAEKITDGKIKDFMGMKFVEFYADQPQFIKDIQLCYESKKSVKREVFYTYKSTGKNKYLEVEYVYVPDDMVMVHTEDISQGKHADLALRESEQRYRLLFENAGEAIYTVDSNGVFRMMNKLAASYHGGEPDDFIGKTLWELYPKHTADKQFSYVSNTLASKEPQYFEEKAIVNGEKIWFETGIFPISGSQNEISTVLLVSHDTTTEKTIKTRMAARFQLLDNLRHAENIDDCLEFGCSAIRDAELFKRAALTIHNEKRE